MRVMTCSELDDVEAELALDMLDGEARGAALAHVEHCASCRARVAQATDAVDILLQLAREAEPPRGFEARVLARLSSVEHRSRRPRRSRGRGRRAVLLLCAALTVVAVAVGSVLLLPVLRGAEDTPAFASTTMRNPGGEAVGIASVRTEQPRWIVLSIPDWQRALAAQYGAGRSYSVRIERVDGTWLEPARPVAADGTWITALDPATSAVHAIEVVDEQGRVWCSGRFVG
jgi:hypothetical protein